MFPRQLRRLGDRAAAKEEIFFCPLPLLASFFKVRRMAPNDAKKVAAPDLVSGMSGHIPKPLRKPVLMLAGLSKLNSIYKEIPRGLAPVEFARRGLEHLGVDIRLEGEPLESIPAEGPLVIVSNHPFGAIEGILLPALFMNRRPDLKILANYILQGIPELRDIFIPVDPFEGSNKAARNLGGLRAAMQHVRNGGALAIFPSGTVSHLHPMQREIVDPEWHATVGRIAHKANAQVLPLFFHGRNSYFFNFMGLIHPSARTALLAKELLRKRNSTITVSVGRVISPATLVELPDDTARTAYLRMRSYAMKPPRKRRWAQAHDPAERKFEPIAEPDPLTLLLEELKALPPRNVLVDESPWLIVESDMASSPGLIREIGRLREITFREVGEGSGLKRDLDEFDPTYRHLILWNSAEQCLVGSYRLGEVDAILAKQGPKGLYSTSLFRFDPVFFRKTSPALELGRAFVRQEYQKDYAPLLLLWKGIGRFILKRPGIRHLFGPVSVSLEYTPFSLKAIMAYLMFHHGAPEYAGLVFGRAAPHFRHASRRTRIDPGSMDWNTLSSIVRDMEGGRTIPILFKHYLKLNGRIATFHVDRSFGTLDAFLTIDLLNVPPRMLGRFMGAEEAQRFLTQTPILSPKKEPIVPDPLWGA